MPINVTVNTVFPNVQYLADGTQTEFCFPFAIFSAADLEVYLDHVLQTDGFSITVNLQVLGGTSGGTVSFSHPPAAGTRIVLRRQIVIQRTTNFQESGELRARALNYELDYLTAALQQVEDAAGRTLHLHPTDSPANLTLPTKDERAGKAMTFDANGNVAVGTLPTAADTATKGLDEVPDGTVNRHFTNNEKVKLQTIEQGAQVNPTNLDGMPDGASRLALTAAERTKLATVAANADANPPAATDPEIAAGTATAARTVSPAQIKAAVTTHAPVSSVAGRTGTISLSQADVPGTVPATRQLTAGAGLTGGGDLSADRSIGVALAPTGGTAGTAATVARSDHSHAPATTTVGGLLAATDKAKLDGIAAGAQVNPTNLDGMPDGASRLALTAAERTKLATVAANADANPPAATDPEIAAGTATAARTVSPAQIKAAVTTHAPVSSVAGRTGTISLSQADVPGTVPATRQLTAGAGLTGGGDLSANRSISVALAPTGGTAGTAATVARSDHSHAPATTTVGGLLAATDKAKLDGIAAGAQVNPSAMTDSYLTTGTDTAQRTISAAQIKLAAQTWGGGGGGTSATDVQLIRLDENLYRTMTLTQTADLLRRHAWGDLPVGPRNLPIRTGLVGIKRARRIDVTSATQAGSNAVSRSNGTINCRVKLNNLMDDLTAKGGGVLFFPPSSAGDPFADYYALTDGPLKMKSNVHFEGRPGYEYETILANAYRNANSSQTQQRCIAHFSSATHSAYHSGTSQTFYPIDNTSKWQSFVVLRNTAQASRFSVGDQIWIMDPRGFLDNYLKPLYSMHNTVVGKNGATLLLSDPIPFSLTNIGSGFVDYAPNGYPTILRLAEVTADTFYSGPGAAWYSEHNYISNMTWWAQTGNAFMRGLPTNSVLANMIILSYGAGIYGNASRNTLWENIAFEILRSNPYDASDAGEKLFMEFSFSMHNRMRGFKVDLASSYPAATSEGPLMQWNECSSCNVIEDFVFDVGQYDYAPTANAHIVTNRGWCNHLLNAEFRMRSSTPGIFFYFAYHNDSIPSKGQGLVDCRYRGIKINYVNGGPTYFMSTEDDMERCILEGIVLQNQAQATNAGATFVPNCGNNILRDIEAHKLNITLNAGANTNEFTRVKQHTGSFTDNATGTITSSRLDPPQLGYYSIK